MKNLHKLMIIPVVFLGMLTVSEAAGGGAIPVMRYPRVQLVEYCEEANDLPILITPEGVYDLPNQQDNHYHFKSNVGQHIGKSPEAELGQKQINEKLITSDITDVIAEGTKQRCHNITKALISKIKEYLKKYSVPVVKREGELKIDVQIKKTSQFFTTDTPVVEEVILTGTLDGRPFFSLEFSQNDTNRREPQRNIRQIGKILAQDIVEKIQAPRVSQ